jgi:hypothetical protein
MILIIGHNTKYLYSNGKKNINLEVASMMLNMFPCEKLSILA